jgi:hypothetical protein
MARFETAFYLGEEKETGYSGVVAEDGLFLAIEVAEGMTPSEGREFLKVLKSEFQMSPPNSLSEIDSLISDLVHEKNLALGFSIALGFLRGDILYLKTTGHGEVIIRRRNKVATLISGNTSASGYFEESDIFVFTTDRFIEVLGGREQLSGIFDHRSPHEIVEEVTPRLTSHDQGAVAIFLAVSKDEMVADDGFIKPRGFLTKFQDDVRGYYLKHGKRKSMTFVAVIIIILIFFWSVVLGYSRRTSAKATEEIGLARELVTQKISEAEEVSFLNTARATVILGETKETLAGLKNKYPDRKEVTEIEAMITTSENKIFKKEEAQSTEFFDLAVDNEKAKGDRLYLDAENLLILDKTAGTLYTLSLDKKSLTENRSADLKKAAKVVLYEDKKYFYVPGAGVFSIGDDNKVNRVIENDRDWGNIADLATYNGNLYLLDSSKDQVYKYVAAESGFGNKTPYFAEGQETDLSIYGSIAIDSSIYLGGNDSIIKFTAGLRDGFSMNLPAKDVGFTKIYTSRDLERVYGWDKKNGMVYVTGKTGEFEKQIKSEILAKGQDFVVYNDEIYVLVGGKIFKIEY